MCLNGMIEKKLKQNKVCHKYNTMPSFACIQRKSDFGVCYMRDEMKPANKVWKKTILWIQNRMNWHTDWNSNLKWKLYLVSHPTTLKIIQSARRIQTKINRTFLIDDDGGGYIDIIPNYN